MSDVSQKLIENAETLAKKTNTDDQGNIQYDGDFFRESLALVDPDMNANDVERSVKALSEICELATELTGSVGQKALKQSKDLDKVNFKAKLGPRSKISVDMLREQERLKKPGEPDKIKVKGVLVPKFEVVNRKSASMTRIKKRHIEMAKDL